MMCLISPSFTLFKSEVSRRPSPCPVAPSIIQCTHMTVIECFSVYRIVARTSPLICVFASGVGESGSVPLMSRNGRERSELATEPPEYSKMLRYMLCARWGCVQDPGRNTMSSLERKPSKVREQIRGLDLRGLELTQKVRSMSRERRSCHRGPKSSGCEYGRTSLDC